MAFEPVFETTKLESLRRLCSSQAVVEARLLPPSGEDIARVLSVATDCAVTPGEVFAGEARYGGRVCFKLLYVDPQGVNRSMDYNADFTDKLNCEQIHTGMKPILSANILDTDVVSVSEREIKLACVLDISLDAVLADSANILVRGGDGIYTHDDSIEYSRLVCECADTFSVSDIVTGVKAVNILLAEPKMIISRIKCGIDSVIAEGKIVCDLCCESADGMIFSLRQTTQFTQEIAAHGSNGAALAAGSGFISTYKAVLETADNAGAITLEFNVSFAARVFSEQTCTPVVDAFSVTHELIKTGESVKIHKNKLFTGFTDRVDGSVTLDVNMPAADNILAVTGAKLNIAAANAEHGRIRFEGSAVCNIIYFSTDTDSKNTVAVELPFSFPVNAGVDEGDMVTARGIITNVSAKIRRGNEIDIKADIEIETSVSASETKFVITELKLGEERVLPTGAFSIHIAKSGETLWDLAKSLGTTPEMVLTNNPRLTLPLTGGERVISYRQLKK